MVIILILYYQCICIMELDRYYGDGRYGFVFCRFF